MMEDNQVFKTSKYQKVNSPRSVGILWVLRVYFVTRGYFDWKKTH